MHACLYIYIPVSSSGALPKDEQGVSRSRCVRMDAETEKTPNREWRCAALRTWRRLASVKPIRVVAAMWTKRHQYNVYADPFPTALSRTQC